MKNVNEAAQILLSHEDLQRIKVLSQLTGETSSARVVMTALELAELVIKNMKEGNKIAIEHPDQQKEYIRITDT